jgi:hypothetical protein
MLIAGQLPFMRVNVVRDDLVSYTLLYQNLLFHAYMKLNMFRAKHRLSSGAQNCTSSLWFCIRESLLDAKFAG